MTMIAARAVAAAADPSGYPPSSLDLEGILDDLRHAAKALAGLISAFNQLDDLDITNVGWLADQAADLAEKAITEFYAHHAANRSYLQRHGLIAQD